jgi:Uma2 family endonuclease
MAEIPAEIVYRPIVQSDPPRSPKETLPTMYDLPSEDPEEPGLPDEFHDLQPQLLSRTLRLAHYSRDNCFTASDLNLYYDVKHPLWHKRPDWFLVVDVPRMYEDKDLRRSYVIWQEGQSPQVVVEFLSPGTEREDLGQFYDASAQVPDPGATPEPPAPVADDPTLPRDPGGSDRAPSAAVANGLGQRRGRVKPPGKFEVYEQYLRIPHYIVYSRYTQRLRHFQLIGGCYQEQRLHPDNPRLWIEDLGIGLGIWDGLFGDIPSHWLRWCDREGRWFLTDTEQAELELEQAELELEQAELELEQAELAKAKAEAQLYQAAQNLLATGMEMRQVAAILGLSEAQVDHLEMQN